jgi:hypothetical protein
MFLIFFLTFIVHLIIAQNHFSQRKLTLIQKNSHHKQSKYHEYIYIFNFFIIFENYKLSILDLNT